jgi:hypothetical protein
LAEVEARSFPPDCLGHFAPVGEVGEDAVTGPVECATCGGALYDGWQGHRCPSLRAPADLSATLATLYKRAVPEETETGVAFDPCAERFWLFASLGRTRAAVPLDRADVYHAPSYASAFAEASARLVRAFAREVGGVGLAPLGLEALERAGVPS